MQSSNMKTAEILLNNCPELVKSQECVNSLIMRNVIDFSTGMKIINGLTSQESEDVENIIGDGKGFDVTFPSATEYTVFKTIMDMSSNDDKENFYKTIDQLNVQFQNAFNKKKEEIIGVIKNMVEIEGTDVEVAKSLTDSLRNSEIVLIKK